MSDSPPTRLPSGASPYRLTGTGAFETVFRDGTRFDGRQVQIIAMPAAQPMGRFGLVVGRKVLPRAIDRNRFKRIVRTGLRAARPAVLGYDVIIRLKAPLKRAGVDEAARDALAVLDRALASLALPRR